MKHFRALFAALIAAFSLSPAARASQYSDLWFNPQESGWGVNVVQQLETAFVTLFVYDANGKPVWYVAPDARITAYGSSGPVFSGALYRTQGPWHGGPFDPTQVTVAPVGNLYLETLSLTRMRVYYSADGANDVVKEVVRQTWDTPLVAANYAAQFILRLTQPDGTNVGRSDYPADVLIHLDAGQFFMRTEDHLGRTCEYRGSHVQAGKISNAGGSFTCTAGDALSGTFEVKGLEVTNNGATGELRTVSANILAAGKFAGARY